MKWHISQLNEAPRNKSTVSFANPTSTIVAPLPSQGSNKQHTQFALVADLLLSSVSDLQNMCRAVVPGSNKTLIDLDSALALIESKASALRAAATELRQSGIENAIGALAAVDALVPNNPMASMPATDVAQEMNGPPRERTNNHRVSIPGTPTTAGAHRPIPQTSNKRSTSPSFKIPNAKRERLRSPDAQD